MRNIQKMALITVALMAVAMPASAQSQTGASLDDVNQAAEGTIKPIINILTKWIFPAMAFIAALYGIGRGVKKGEWDFAAMCIVASLVLALLPQVLTKLFKIG